MRAFQQLDSGPAAAFGFRMKSILLFLFLLLFYCFSPAVSQGQSEASVPQEDDVPLELPVLWDELQSLKELVLSLKAVEVEQRQALRSMASRLRDGEVEARQQRQSLDGLEDELRRTEAERKQLLELNSDLTRKVEELEERSRAEAVEFSSEVSMLRFRLNTSESSVDDLRKKNTAAAAELPFLQTRLRASETMLEQLRRKNAVLAVRLCHTESLLEELTRQTSAFPGSNSSSQTGAELEQLNSRALQSRLNSLEEKLNASAGRDELRDQVSEISSRQRSNQVHLDELERRSADQSAVLWSVERRLEELKTQSSAAELSAVESKLMETKTQTEVQADAVKQLQVQLDSVESQVQQLETDGTDESYKLMDLQRKLNSTETLLDQIHTELEVRLRAAEKHVEHLQSQNSAGLKVAFSAALTDSGSVGPFDDQTTLVFSKNITNVGQAYNQSTGVFTAPVRGLYFFSFTAADYLKGYMGLHLYRNNQPIVFNLELNDHGGYASTSNAVALQLEEGDGVRLRLPATYRLYDDSRNFSVFSGFLLFPL